MVLIDRLNKHLISAHRVVMTVHRLSVEDELLGILAGIDAFCNHPGTDTVGDHQ